MIKATNLFVCLLVLFGMAGCTNSISDVDKIPVDLTKAQDFAMEKTNEYMKILGVKSYNITETSLITVAKNDNRFIYVIEADVVKEQGNKNFIYGFDIIDRGNSNFEVIHQGEEVNSMYLTK